MLYITKYGFKQDTSPETTRAMLAAHAERGPLENESAHYLRFDGAGGIVLSRQVPDMTEQYESVLRFQQWMTMETTPVLPLEEAMPTIMKVYG